MSVPRCPGSTHAQKQGGNFTITNLTDGCILLEQAGAQVIVVACNTVHKFIDEMRAAVSVPILSIIEETVHEVQRKNLKRVLVLGTPYTIESRLYEQKLEVVGISSPKLSRKERALLLTIIQSVLQKGPTRESTNRLVTLIQKYEREVDGVVLGCTELPLLMKDSRFRMPMFDTVHIIADAVYNYSITP